MRRELAINFVRFNPRYDNFDACEPWADRHAAHTRAGLAPVYLFVKDSWKTPKPMIRCGTLRKNRWC